MSGGRFRGERALTPSVDLGPLTQFPEISTSYQEFPAEEMKVGLKTMERLHPPLCYV
jgi:hypothetical protein